MSQWQLWQTTRVLRRLATIVWTHIGFSFRPFCFKSASFRIWWTWVCSVDPHSSHVPASTRFINSTVLGFTVMVVGTSSIRPLGCRLSAIPPKRAIKGFFPSLSTLTSKHRRCPSAVLTVLLYRFTILFTLSLCLAESVLSSDVSITQRSWLRSWMLWARV